MRKVLIDYGWLVYLLAAAAGFAAIILLGRDPAGRQELAAILDQNRGPLYSALASVFGSMLGFSIAAVTIVLSVVETRRMKLVRASAAYPKLWTAFHLSIWTLALATVAAIVALAVDRDNSPKYWITAAVAGVSIYASLTLANAIWILQEVVGIATRQNERQA